MYQVEYFGELPPQLLNAIAGIVVLGRLLRRLIISPRDWQDKRFD